MPRADRVSLTAAGLSMPAVDHLSNKSTLNLVLDRTISGLSTGLPAQAMDVGLFMNFCRLTDKSLREYDAARARIALLRITARWVHRRSLSSGDRPFGELCQCYASVCAQCSGIAPAWRGPWFAAAHRASVGAPQEGAPCHRTL